MKKNKTKIRNMFLLIVICLVGYAALNSTLKIDGTFNIARTKWNVHFENISVKEGSVSATTAPTSNNETTKEVTYAVNLKNPGDYYEFTMDIKNSGTLDAAIEKIETKAYAADGTTEISTLPKYIKLVATYEDGDSLNSMIPLKINTSKKILIRVEFKGNVELEDLPDTSQTIVFKVTATATQTKNIEECPEPTTFDKDNWNTILCNMRKNPESYSIGEKKNVVIRLDFYEDGKETLEATTIRIANNTTPSECSNSNFSQTACGIVIEFEKSIKIIPFNSATHVGVNGTGNIGGWEYSEVRQYVNGTLYNLLPSKIKNAIIDTKVVSSHGSDDAANFITTDKIYLFSTKEIYGKRGTDPNHIITGDTAEVETRQLDYYESHGVNTNFDNTNGYAIKRSMDNDNSDYWTRTSHSGNNFEIYEVSDDGFHGRMDAYDAAKYISPAFRIG